MKQRLKRLFIQVNWKKLRVVEVEEIAFLIVLSNNRNKVCLPLKTISDNIVQIDAII